MCDVHYSLDHHLRKSGGWSCINICVMHATVGTSIFGVTCQTVCGYESRGARFCASPSWNTQWLHMHQYVRHHACKWRDATYIPVHFSRSLYITIIVIGAFNIFFLARVVLILQASALTLINGIFFVVDAQKSATSIIQTQSKSSMEGTTGLNQNILLVSIGKRAKMTPVDEQVFIVPAKKKELTTIECILDIVIPWHGG